MLTFSRVPNAIDVNRELVAESSPFLKPFLKKGDDLLFRLRFTRFFYDSLPFEQVAYTIPPLFFCILEVGMLATKPVQAQLVKGVEG